ncbi:MAG: hypothetical protein H7281_07570 [Bacteriovorax sp.]|nr:hypothetical protein [Bacteriovorax sp.]
MKFLAALTYILSLSAHAAGGVSGGGGNLISPIVPLEKQDPREIRHIIRGSKDLLKNFVDAKYALYLSGSMDFQSLRLYSALFADSKHNLHEVMEKITIDIPLDKPCYDNQGQSFDGSTVDQTSYSICISAFNIAQKCDENQVPLQATALIFHEFSEVAGLSDEDAITLQTEVLNELKVW